MRKDARSLADRYRLGVAAAGVEKVPAVRWVTSISNNEVAMGTFDTGPFGNDGALDLLDSLRRQPADQRREVLDRIFFRVLDRPDLLGWKFFPDEIVAAAAVVAASLPGGEGVRQDLADRGYEADTILPPASDAELNASAAAALQLAAGRDGPWHDGWTNPEDAAQARQTANRLASIFLREQHSQDQELPFTSFDST